MLKLSKFKKISGDATHSVMQHEAGHTMRIEHKALSPKIRAQMVALPTHSEDKRQNKGNAKLQESKKVPNEAAMAKPMAEGGEVKDPRAEKWAAIQKGFNSMQAGGPPKKEGKPAYFGGGRVSAEPVEEPKKDELTPEQKAVREEIRKSFLKMFPDGKEHKAEGGIAGEQVQAKEQQQAPVTINIGTPPAPQAAAPQPMMTPMQPQESMPPGMTGATGVGPMPTPPGMTGVTGQAPEAPAPEEGPKGTSGIPGQIKVDAPLNTTEDLPPAQLPDQVEQSQAAPAQGGGMGGDPYGTEAYYGSLAKGIEEQKAGHRLAAETAAAQGAQEAQVLAKAQANQESLQNDYKTHYQELETERKHLADDIKSAHIDPNHYWNSKSTGGKVATLIGMFIGGLGQNDVPALIQQNIDRDIDAQKANLGKKENLLSANMKQFGNLRDAVAMTKVMQSDVIKTQLEKAAALAKGPMEKARALQGIGMIDTQNAQALSQIAMRRTLLNGAKTGQVPPEHVIRMVVPEGERAKAYSELQDAQNMVKARDKAMAVYDAVAKLQTAASRLGSPIQSKRQIDAMINSELPGISKMTAGRFTEQDAAMIEKVLRSSLFDDGSTVAKNRQHVFNMFQDKMSFPILKAYGLDPAAGSRYTSGGQSRIQESAPILNKR